MKKWFIGCFLCSFLLVGNAIGHADTQQESSSVQTEVTVKLARPILSDKLPGTNSNGNVAKPGKLPQTNDENYLFYSILGGVIVGSVICFAVFKKKQEEEVDEQCIR